MVSSIAGDLTCASLPESVKQDLRMLPTDELLLQQDLMKRIRLDSDDVSSVIATLTLTAINDELTYRRRLVARHQQDPLCPKWPDTSEKAYQSLLDRARDLKTLWPIEAFVTRFMAVPLRRTGRRLIGQCPLPDHQDKTPSFTVFPADDRWYCFGCNRGGDIFELTGLYFGIERFRDKVQKVEDATPGMIERAS